MTMDKLLSLSECLPHSYFGALPSFVEVKAIKADWIQTAQGLECHNKALGLYSGNV